MEPRNVRIREVEFTTKDQVQNEIERRKQKKAKILKMMGDESNIESVNRRKLLVNWRNIMRIAKTDKLKSELEVYAQANQRELDSQEAYLQMLDKNLEDAEDQYNLSLRNHLIQIGKLTDIRDARIQALKAEFDRTATILEHEFNSEAREIHRTHNNQIKELSNMADCNEEEEQSKQNLMMEEFQTAVEQTKQRAKEEMEIMTSEMRSKQGTLSNYLETLYQRYMNDTNTKFTKFKKLREQSVSKTTTIKKTMRKISQTKEWIKQMDLKIASMEAEFSQRHKSLTNEKRQISDNFLKLKNKMARFRDGKKQSIIFLISRGEKEANRAGTQLKIFDGPSQRAGRTRREDFKDSRTLQKAGDREGEGNPLL